MTPHLKPKENLSKWGSIGPSVYRQHKSDQEEITKAIRVFEKAGGVIEKIHTPEPQPDCRVQPNLYQGRRIGIGIPMIQE